MLTDTVGWSQVLYFGSACLLTLTAISYLGIFAL